jgi:hypothetical protein
MPTLQNAPGILGEMRNATDAEKSQRIMATILNMKKIDISKLKRADA